MKLVQVFFFFGKRAHLPGAVAARVAFRSLKGLQAGAEQVRFRDGPRHHDLRLTSSKLLASRGVLIQVIPPYIEPRVELTTRSVSKNLMKASGVQSHTRPVPPPVGKGMVDGNQGMSAAGLELHTAATNLLRAVCLIAERVEGRLVADGVGSTQQPQQLLSVCLKLAKAHKLQRLELSLYVLQNVRVVSWWQCLPFATHQGEA